MKSYDLVVIGAGPAGEVGAIRAAQLGRSVALVDKRLHLGGTCLNVGCIPTKALIEAGKTWEKLQNVAKLGFDIGTPTYDWSAIQKRKQDIVDAQRRGLRYLMQKNNIACYTGTAMFADPHTIRVTNETETVELHASQVLIATGSKVRPFPLCEENGTRIFSSDSMLEIPAVPPSLAVIGGGVVGVEFACLFAMFGSRVEVYEVAPQILPHEDPECVAELQRGLHRRGVRVHVATPLRRVVGDDTGVELTFGDASEQKSRVDAVLIATGRMPVTADLGLERVGVTVTAQGHIPVDAHFRTVQPHIFAVGDCIDTPALAHTASAEAKHAAELIAGLQHPAINYATNPSAVYTVPEIASMGQRTSDLAAAGIPFKTIKFPFHPNAKAKIEDATEGFIKILHHTTTHELLGVHIVGARATELISSFCLGARLESTVDEIGNTIHPHPTLSETIMEAAHMATGPAIHL